MKLDSMVLTHVEKPLLKVHGKAGANFPMMIKESLMLAISNEVKVELVINDKVFEINPNKILHEITKQHSGLQEGNTPDGS